MKLRWIPLVVAFMLPMLVMLPLTAAADIGDKATKLLLNDFNGTILDFDASRILWKADNKVLWLYNRTNGAQVKVVDRTGAADNVSQAKLSAQGVVYNLKDPKLPKLNSVYSWKNGQASRIATGEDLYDIRGNGKVALLSQHTVDLTTGQIGEFGFNRIEIAPDGTMIYTAPVAPVGALALFQTRPDGTVMRLAEPSNKVASLSGAPYGYYGPVTDGKSILYTESVESDHYRNHVFALRLRNADETVTTLSVGGSYQPNFSYRINNGWIAYIEFDRVKRTKYVNIRSPEGVVKRVFESPHWWSWANAPLTIDDLGPDGTVAFTSFDKTYLSYPKEDKPVSIHRSPAKFQYREHVFGGPGGSPIRGGVWYLINGGSLYAVRI
ncbi:hypothetical protein [Paenibacillus sp. GCM10023250]|uniref:hypothetical protein n=1 Tax=Paenibacillus sp. GCM10023250 TaxID=3252648 RepID=UPI00360A4E67